MGYGSRYVIAAIALLSAAAGGCGAKTRTEGGTDGATHWLRSCESDAQCGELQCLCGVCSESCTSEGSCARFGEEASCGGTCGGTELCVRESSQPPVDGGDGDGDGDGDDSSAPDCRAMDARSGGTLCALVLGYAWNGESCQEVVCDCAGEDCDALYETKAACDEARTAVCPRVDACEVTSDCQVRERGCCACSTNLSADVFAMSSSGASEYEDRVCEPDQGCPECEGPSPVAQKRYTATCTGDATSTGSRCELVNLTRLPCTEDAGCVISSRGCCGSCSAVTVDEVFAAPADMDVRSLFCDSPEAACTLCDDTFPDNVSARCGDSGYCELYEDGVLVER